MVTISKEKKAVVIGTDQNIDYLKINEHNKTSNFLDINLDSGLVPMITRPTPITNSSATLIDNICNNNLSHVKSLILLSGISDHLPCCLYYGSSRTKKKEPITIKTRKLNDKKILSIKSYLSSICWDNLAHPSTYVPCTSAILGLYCADPNHHKLYANQLSCTQLPHTYQQTTKHRSVAT